MRNINALFFIKRRLRDVKRGGEAGFKGNNR